MLSVKQKKELYESCSALPEVERKLMGLHALCNDFTKGATFNERLLAQAIIKSNLADQKGNAITLQTYEDIIKKFKKLKFSENKNRFTIYPELCHGILILLSEVEIQWVCSLVDKLYPKHRTDYIFDENSTKAKILLTKAIYTNSSAYFSANQQALFYNNTIIVMLNSIFDEQEVNITWLQERHPIIRDFLLISLLSGYACECSSTATHVKEIVDFFSQQQPNDQSFDYLNYYSAIIHISIGNNDTARAFCAKIKDQKSGFALALQATFALLSNDFPSAQSLYPKALSAIRKQFESRYYYFDNILGFFHCIYMVYIEKNLSQLNVNIQQYVKLIGNWQVLPMQITYNLLSTIEQIEKGNPKSALEALTNISKKMDDIARLPLPTAIKHLLFYMVDKEYVQKNKQSLSSQAQLLTQGNQMLAAQIIQELLNKQASQQTPSASFQFLDLIQVKDSWEYSFQALEGLLLDRNHTEITKTQRLLWLLDTDKQYLEVIEQTSTKKGGWTTGRAVRLSKLKQEQNTAKFSYLTEEDKRVIACIVAADNYWPYQDDYQFDTQRALPALIGNKNIVHHQNKSVAIELLQGEAELHIEEKNNGYHLALSHWLPNAGIILEPESLNKYRVVDYSTSLNNIGQILTQAGLTIPAEAKDKILKVIQHAKRDIKIHVDIKDMAIPEMMGDPTPCVQLLPIKEGVKINLWVRPQINQGAYCKIGLGKEHFMAVLTENGQEIRTRVARNFKIEKENVSLLLSQCPNMPPHENEPGEYEINTPEETLEVLSELQNYALSQPLIIEWPQGQTFKIKQRVLAQNLSLKIASENNWFAFDGQITLNDGEILSMQALLDSIGTQRYGRFVRLENGEFIELTSKLKKQLGILHAIADGNKINPLGAQVLSDIANEAELATFDKGWEEHLKKIQSMKSYAPKLPSTLQASLRDYQIEGFHYLSRLTHWGIGACLADDMGLGKTIQTIALLLERAKNGASLVIAPTSICFNWIEELNKFAPTLKVHNLRTEDRAARIEKAGPFDVIVCSYGLLQHNADLLTNKHWETLVLDEAQAIKNANTLRWKAVMKLKGKSRVALSGTPIENHLGELWSIFSFINPGLLGTIKSFQNKYSGPIENSQSPEKVQALKSLVNPYILRRIKSEVLSELPAKTEQTIYIEQTSEEAAFYEALRRQAEKKVADLMRENNRIGVLAEITKLRQACCDSSLVDKKLSIPNSKLHAFIETVKNIIDNGHKALVFSQYVSFLQIIKARIEQENLSYQYLDGSTSPANRKKSVEAFQNGEGDLFLLSLKAGGSGLNLTAADYVIHLDPWWNPAVEDQASDRAHRIGQERPVTIYRFIMQNTIEEKIIKLHQHKRNLANDLLSGQGTTGKLSNDDLINLINKANA